MKNYRMNYNKMDAVIIGLGNVGFLFDEDPDRIKSNEIGWTHFTAYSSLSKFYNISAVIDQDFKKLSLVKNKGLDIDCYQNIESLLKSDKSFDIFSICTPNKSHLELVKKLKGKAKAIFLEKPISSFCSNKDLLNFHNQILNDGISIRVNYYKINEPSYLMLNEIIDRKKIRYCSLKYSGPVEAVGSHALSVVLNLIEDIELVKFINYPCDESYGTSAIFYSKSLDIFAEIIHCNDRHNLIFELEVIDNKNKAVLMDNFSRLKIYKYEKSTRYSLGYNEIKKVNEYSFKSNKKRFTYSLEEIHSEIYSKKRDYTNLNQSIKVQNFLNNFLRKSK